MAWTEACQVVSNHWNSSIAALLQILSCGIFFIFSVYLCSTHRDSTLTVVADYESCRGGTFFMQLVLMIFEWKILHSYICYYPDAVFLWGNTFYLINQMAKSCTTLVECYQTWVLACHFKDCYLNWLMFFSNGKFLQCMCQFHQADWLVLSLHCLRCRLWW